tara:strand:+ start:162 stop:275 length:114 start_codon:yes stop_codon:yes gene_type:complete
MFISSIFARGFYLKNMPKINVNYKNNEEGNLSDKENN